MILVAACVTMLAACSTNPSAAAGLGLHAGKVSGSLRLAAGAEPLWSAAVQEPMVALTFDDGPDPRFTPSILSELQRKHVPATFFVLGSFALAHPALVDREVRLGEEVGCHGWNHRLEIGWTAAATVRAFRACAAEVQRIDHVRPVYTRAPYGLLRSDQVAALRRAGFTDVDWNLSVSPVIGRPQLLDADLARIRPGAIILLHDGRGDRSGVVRLLPRLIEGLQARGFDMVTIDQLVAGGRGRLEPAGAECSRLRFYHRSGIVPASALTESRCTARSSRRAAQPLPSRKSSSASSRSAGSSRLMPDSSTSLRSR